MALQDAVDGLSLWALWGKLGWNDILQRYRRSLLGPLWLTASMAVMVVSLGLVYSKIFKAELRDFMPFLCVGLLVWGYISAILSEAGALFTGAESYIKQIRLPYSVYVLRFMWSKVIVFAHNFVIYFGILIYFQIWPGITALYAIPGFLLVTVNGALTSMYLGMMSARFRDIPQIVASFIQIVFFITPIMWKPELLGGHENLIKFNPFFHLVEIVRAPLLGQLPSAGNYLAVALITALNAIFAILFFVRFRARISYWV
ncbi:MAG: ABC transporter permease [Candidatus Afipia apatlaquensis]|uniref:ABC transporter permease n=1 Tax=Candidatus Afipia apatlaquensis TaxID=2712852 RepID=A0A7C9RIK5_9BRAD|nr:ABC transporter permease [Candidatus Afipia apatlaquensis]